MNQRRALLVLPLLLALPLPAAAINVVVDYSFDSSGFLPAGGAARATLEQAAADLSAVLADGQLSAVTTTSYTGNSGASNATANWGIGFLHPNTNVFTSVPSPTIAADEFRIFVGWRNLSDSTLGQGSSGGASLNLSSTNTGGDFAGAVDALELSSNAGMTRGGPVFSNYSGNFASTTYSLDYGPLVGSLWFDSDRDGNGITDTQGELETLWNLGLSAPGGAQTDFYSVALHEMIHAIGFAGVPGNPGGTDAFKAIQPDPLIANSHFVPGTMSTRFSDGVAQLALMNPSLTTGTRRSITNVDVEYLEKMGYAVVPEPGSAGLLGLLGIGALLRRRR